MASRDGNPCISRPRPLMKRSKTASDTTPSSRRRKSLSSTVPSRESGASTSSQDSGSSSSMMANVIRILNTPIVDLNTPRVRPSQSEGSTLFSQFSRKEEKQRARDEQPRPGSSHRTATSLRATTMSLLSDYSTFRSSIMSGSTTSRGKDDIIASATRYYKSMQEYLGLVDQLPFAIRDTLEVQRMRQQLEFTIELLEPVLGEDKSEQILLILDDTLVLVKNLLSDVQYLLLQQTNRSVPDLEEEQDEDSSSEVVPLYEYDIPKAHLAILMSESDQDGPIPERGGYLRKMRSSMAMLGGSSRQKEPARDSDYTTAEGSQHGSISSDERSTSTRRVRFTVHESRTSESLAELSKNIEAVADSLTAINACPLFTRASRPVSVGPINKPEDTVDITYGQDGIPVAMSPNAIIKQLIKDLRSRSCETDAPTSNFSDIIFTTFRFFWRPEVFLEYLNAAYDNSYYRDRKLTVVLLARTWVLAYWVPQDSQTPGLIKKMQCFLGKPLKDGLISTCIIIDVLARLRQYSNDPRRSAIVHEFPELEYEPMPFRLIDISRDMPLLRGNYHCIRVMDFNNSTGCLELARQLTLKESELYLQLTAMEVIGCFVADDQDEETVLAKEKMRNWRDFSCALKRWAAWNILKRSTALKRARAFGFMMRLAKYLLGLRNFSSAHAVYNGALSIHLDNLKTTEAELLPKARRNMSYITEFFDRNREISMQSSAEPIIPIMATYAGKLSRLLGWKGITTPSKVDKSVELINISFFRAATRITYAMESNQHPYDFKAHAPLQHFIDYTLKQPPDENKIHELYLEVKQEEQTAEIPRSGLMQRLRTNSIMAIQRL